MKSLLAAETDFSVKRHFSVTCVLITLALTLTATSSAEAAGFNVNSNVTFTPLASTYRTSNNTTGCPSGFAAKFTFTALLTNKPDSPAMPGVTVRVQTLTNGNVLLDPQTNGVLGGEGAEMVVPKAGQYADGLLSPGESVNVPFVLCLKTPQPFQFFVDVFGVVTKLVSVSRYQTNSGNDESAFSTLSADGRFIAFTSFANDLVERDTNGKLDVFVRDLQTGKTTLVSVNQAGTDSGNGASSTRDPVRIPGTAAPDIPVISAKGRFVVFTSWASDLVPNDTNGQMDVFVRDLETMRTSLVSANRFGTDSGNGLSWGLGCGTAAECLALVSADGRFVLFTSGASDLVPNDSNGTGDVFLRDLQTGTTTLVTVNRFGTNSGNSDSYGGYAISADGRFVAFTSYASDLTATADTNNTQDTFVRDIVAGKTTMVSVNRFGTDSGNATSYSGPAISADGRYIAFLSYATDLTTTADANNEPDVFVRDMLTGKTTMVSVNSAGTDSGNARSEAGLAISADGRLVIFTSYATNLAPNSSGVNVFVRNLETATTSLVGSGLFSSLSGDARFVSFAAAGYYMTFVYDMQTGTTRPVSINRAGTAFSPSAWAVLSADGRFVAFSSDASDLVATDTNGRSDVFVRPVP